MGVINDRLAIGIDLGQKSDPTAIAVVQTELRGSEWHHTARFLQRLPLGTSYPDVVARVKQVASNAVSNLKKIQIMNMKSFLCYILMQQV